MLQVPFELMLEQLQLMPGRNGLAALFKMLQQAEAVTIDDEVRTVRDGAEVPVYVMMRLTRCCQ